MINLKEFADRLKEINSDDIDDYNNGWYKCLRCEDTVENLRTCGNSTGHILEIFHKFIDKLLKEFEEKQNG